MYHSSDMILTAHSNTSYLSEPKARSRVGGHFFMSINTAFPPNNGNTEQVIKQVMSSAAEAKLGALYINSKLATQLQHTLAEMGHLQPPTLVQTDNSTTYGVVTNKIIPKATKAMDMHSHWLHNQEQQKLFLFIYGRLKPTMPTTRQSIIQQHITN